MPRYFFNRIDGKRDADNEGIELAGLADARYEAIAFAADTLKDDSFALWDGGEVRIEVVDSARVLIFSIVISVVDDTTKMQLA